MSGITQLSPSSVPGPQYGDCTHAPSDSSRDVNEITRLATCGAPGRRYGSFDRSAAGRDVGEITRLATCGAPGRRYSSFERTPQTADQVTRLATCATPGERYGNFTRTPVAPPAPTAPHRSMGGVIGLSTHFWPIETPRKRRTGSHGEHPLSATLREEERKKRIREEDEMLLLSDDFDPIAWELENL